MARQPTALADEIEFLLPLSDNRCPVPDNLADCHKVSRLPGTMLPLAYRDLGRLALPDPGEF